MYNGFDVSMPFEEIDMLLELSLLHNKFLFKDQLFPQTSGTAMDKEYAPCLAKIFMANLEGEVLRKGKFKPLVMFRFIDGISFFIWNHSRYDLAEFINLFNSHDKSIKIDCNINESTVEFLDVTIFLDFLATLFWTLRYILRKRTHMNWCIKSLFIQNIWLRGSWNHSLSDS